MRYYEKYDSPMGPLWLAGNDNGLTQLRFPEEFTPEGETAPHEMFVAVRNWLDDYFRGEIHQFDFPLAPEGTPFQKLIWQLLLELPFGKTRTYGDLAREAARIMGKEKMSAQAVGQAVGRNPIPIIIPCHRILGSGGSLTGFSCGIHRKIWLLQHEGWKMNSAQKAVLNRED